MSNYEFGNRLCQLRENNKMTQRQLAYHLGVTDKAVSKWENAETQPKADMIAAIAHFFGVTVDELLNGGQDKGEQSASRESCLSPLYTTKTEEEQTAQRFPSLLKESEIITNDYMCSWRNQGKTAKKLGLTGEYGAPTRDALNAERLFETTEYYHPVSRELRRDLIFLLDDGWDVPYGIGKNGHEEFLRGYGAVDPDQERFPNFGKTPVERLKTLRRKVEALGYRGVGLWISPQQSGERELNMKEAEKYWEERARWCHEAGVMYWKVDWGYHGDVEYREMMSRAVRKYAPNLVIEHAVVQQPLAFLMTALGVGKPDYPAFRQQMVNRLMGFSDVYRTYDLVEPFHTSATLSRAHEAFAADAERVGQVKGIINAESEPYISAALGCIVGIMEYTKEMEVCVRWHRVAPPFGIYDAEYSYSEEMLTDNFFYDANVRWVQCGGKYFEETAPAIMARNCEMPKVVSIGEHKPFIAASKNPYTGVYSIAAYRRTVDPNGMFIAPADVTLQIDKPDVLVGVFGVFHSLSLECSAGYPEDFCVYAQNLLDEQAIDITEFVRIEGNRITINGCDLRVLGRIPDGDPALAVQVRERRA